MINYLLGEGKGERGIHFREINWPKLMSYREILASRNFLWGPLQSKTQKPKTQLTNCAELFVGKDSVVGWGKEFFVTPEVAS